MPGLAQQQCALRIEKAQNKAMRIIYFADYHAPVEPLFKEKHIIRINDFITLQNILFVALMIISRSSRMCMIIIRLLTNWVCFMHPKSTLQCMVYTLYRKKCVVSWNFYTRKLSSNLNNLSRAQLKTNISQYMIDQY